MLGEGAVETVLQGERVAERELVLHCDATEEAELLGESEVVTVLQAERAAEREFELLAEREPHDVGDSEPVLHRDPVIEAVLLGEGVVVTVLQGEGVAEREMVLHCEAVEEAVARTLGQPLVEGVAVLCKLGVALGEVELEGANDCVADALKRGEGEEEEDAQAQAEGESDNERVGVKVTVVLALWQGDGVRELVGEVVRLGIRVCERVSVAVVEIVRLLL